MSDLDKSWKLAAIKHENEELYHELYRERSANRTLHIMLENTRGECEGFVDRGDAFCGSCGEDLGNAHDVTASYRFCPFCGVHIDGWGEL